MLHHDKIEIFEGIDINRTSFYISVAFVVMIVFFMINFGFQPCVYGVCHDFLKKATNFNKISVKGNIGRTYFCGIAKDKIVHLMKKANLN